MPSPRRPAASRPGGDKRPLVVIDAGPRRHRSRRRRLDRRAREGHRVQLRPAAARAARGDRPLPGRDDPRPGRVRGARRARAGDAGGKGRSLHLDPRRFDLRRRRMSGAARSIPARSARPTPNSANLAERENKADAVAGLESRDSRERRRRHPPGADAAGDARLLAPLRQEARRQARSGDAAEQEAAPARPGSRCCAPPTCPRSWSSSAICRASAISTSSSPTNGATARPPRWRRRSTVSSARASQTRGRRTGGRPSFTIDAVSKDVDVAAARFLR